MVAKYHELYTISGLALGADRRDASEAERFAAFVDSLTERPARRRVALVVLGDLLDLSSEALDPAAACRRIRDLAKDPELSAGLAALSRFVKKKDRHLVWVPGPRERELAFPEVRDELEKELCGRAEANRARLVFALEGSYACKVGRETVLLVPGAELDPWRAPDRAAQAAAVRARAFGGRTLDLAPAPADRLESELLSELREERPWLDLLPAAGAELLPLALAVEPARRGIALALAADLLPEVERRARALGLGAEQGAESLDALLRRAAPDLARAEGRGEAGRLLDRVEGLLDRGYDGFDLLGEGTSVLAEDVELDPDRERDEALRAALAFLFDRVAPVEVGRAGRALETLVSRVAGTSDHLVTTGCGAPFEGMLGADESGRRGVHAIDCGSWAPRLALTPADLADADAFAPLARVMLAQEATGEDLASAVEPGRELVERAALVACHVEEEGEVIPFLARFVPTDEVPTGDLVPLERGSFDAAEETLEDLGSELQTADALSLPDSTAELS